MNKIEQLLAVARRRGADAVALVPGTNLRYITGVYYHAGERLSMAVFDTNGRCGFVMPAMDAARTARECDIPFTLYPWDDSQPPQESMSRMIGDLGLRGRVVAVEHGAMRVFELMSLQLAGVGDTPDAAPILTELRIVKDAAELAIMQEAARMIDDSLDRLLPKIRPGMTERQVASVWLTEILNLGAEGPAFEFIIASGPNASSPHHGTGERVLQMGDMVILDGGARHRGYNSDITRTVSLGQPSPENRRIYDVVLAANSAGRDSARPGMTGRQLDACARKVIEDAGFGENFMHRTGHGLGMDIHEPPYVAATWDEPLPVGCVFTIEPGIYLPGRTGVRIEDDVVMTETGGLSLTRYRRELIVL
jgi:Xaa-Pro dipeptidase